LDVDEIARAQVRGVPSNLDRKGKEWLVRGPVATGRV